MIGGRQVISLLPNVGFAAIVHEIGHAAGLMHEQSRSDRDVYININYSNIVPDWQYQYNTYNVQGRNGSQLGSFDFYSVMIYPSFTTSSAYPGNTTPQMTKKDGTTWNAGWSLSQGDIDAVNFLYTPIKINYFITDENINEINEYTNKSTHNVSINFYDYIANYVVHYINLPKPIKLKVISTRKDYYNHQYTYEIHESIVVLPVNTQDYYLGTEIYNELYDQNMNEMDGSYTVTYHVVRLE